LTNYKNFELLQNPLLGNAISVYPLPSDAELDIYYEQKYWQSPDRPHTEDYSQEERNYLCLQSKVIASLVPLVNFSALDIGCGEGFLLKQLLDSGHQAIGLDLGDFAVNKFNPSAAPHLIKGNVFLSLDTFIEKNQKFDVIFLNHIFEHLPKPDELLDKLKLVLTDPGFLVISVPNDYSDLQKAMKAQNYYQDEYFVKYPDHLHYFTGNSLAKLLSSKGYSFVDGIADFPIEWFIANDSSNYARNPAVGKAAHSARIFLETQINTKDPQLVLDFWRSLFRLGQGRSITAIFNLNGDV
jgi:2-polyprenyl-3-methyl-5-hydroxy-6-metoxy-1,4-benzoquinol methylase